MEENLKNIYKRGMGVKYSVTTALGTSIFHKKHYFICGGDNIIPDKRY